MSDAVRGQLKVLFTATRWSRGKNPIGRNAIKKLVKYGILMEEVYDAKHFQILRTLLGIVWNHLIQFSPIFQKTRK